MTNDTGAPTGYQANLQFFAERYPQDKFEFVSIKLPVSTIVNGMIHKPDPDQRASHNRKMTKAHAVGFGEYVRNMKNPPPFIPPLFVWATKDEVTFADHEGVTPPGFGIEFGIASLNRNARLRILDGQHRTYGLYDAVEKLEADIDKAQAQLQATESTTPELVPEVRAKVKKLKQTRDRVLGMVVEVTIALVNGPDDAKQIFVDMADNQKGMNPTVTASFDRRKVYNRVAAEITENDPLAGFVDFEQSRPGKGTWTTLSDVAVVCQTIAFGLGGRWSQAKEDEADSERLRRRCVNFYDDLVTAFPVLNEVLVGGSRSPDSLRAPGSASLLGSMTMVRVFAAVWDELQTGRRGRKDGFEKLSRAEILQFFRSLPTDAGEDEEGRRRLADQWLQSGVFRGPWVAPSARQGDTRKLANFIMDWAREGEAPVLVTVGEAEAQAA